MSDRCRRCCRRFGCLGCGVVIRCVVCDVRVCVYLCVRVCIQVAHTREEEAAAGREETAVELARLREEITALKKACHESELFRRQLEKQVCVWLHVCVCVRE